MSSITLRVPDDLGEALRRYLQVAGFRALWVKLVARARAAGIHTDEDVFEVLEKA